MTGKWTRWMSRPLDWDSILARPEDMDMYNPKGLDIACAIPSRTTREEPIMDKTRFAETLDVQDPELQLLSAVINEEFDDAMHILKSTSPKDRAILSFHLGQLLSMSAEADTKDRPWTGTGA